MLIGSLLARGLLVLQGVLLFRAYFSRDRYFAWAPYDEIVEYDLAVWHNGRRLTGQEIRRIFGIPARGRENRCACHLFQKLEWKDANTPDYRMEMLYCLHGRKPARWVRGPETAKGSRS